MKSKNIFILSLLISIISCNSNESNFIDLFGISESQFQIIKSNSNLDISKKVRKIENISLFNSETLNQVLDSNYKLIVKFSSLECSYCIDQVLNYADKNIEKIGKENIIFLGYFHDEISYINFSKTHNLKYKLYRLKKNHLSETLDVLESPYILLLNDALNLKKALVPNKSKPKRTEKFLIKYSKI